MERPFWRWVTSPLVRPEGHPQCAVILPNLLVGEYPTPADAAWLRTAQGVTAVLSLQDDADLASKALDLRELERAYRAAELRFHHVPVPDCDVRILAARLDETVDVLTTLLGQGERVYLHCNAGLNRAPTVAIAYLHTQLGLSLVAARDFVRERRQCAPYMTVLQSHYGAARE
jgi:protein-tyrosine phosphatase